MKSGLISEEKVIGQYVAICNEALLKNAHRFPFKQILDAAEKSGQNRIVEARIADHNYKNSFVLNLKEGRIHVKPHQMCNDCNCDYIWDVSLDYLEEVLHNPAQYISNPAKLDWDWLYLNNSD